jgi:hypothetical protein
MRESEVQQMRYARRTFEFESTERISPAETPCREFSDSNALYDDMNVVEIMSG